jgi:hypothetical protein
MPSNAMTKIWSEVTEKLREAFRELSLPKTESGKKADLGPSLLTGSQEEFFEFLEHNELELAWDTLAEMGDRSRVGQSFWLKLSQAAKAMKLIEKESAAFKKSQA